MKIQAFVDVGGSTTRLVLVDERERIIENLSWPTDVTELKDALKRTLPESHSLYSLTIGLRGVWKKNEKRGWQKTLRGLAAQIIVLSDVELAYRLALKNGDGILLNAGTGAIAFGKKGKKFARAGGLGPFLGDEGSGFWLGKEFLKRTYEKNHKLDFIRPYATGPNPVPKIAELAKRILHSQSPIHRQLKNESLQHLLDLCLEVAKDLKLKKPILVRIVGGLFKNKNFRTDFSRLAARRGIVIR
jgi:hypothetical protein